MKLFVEHAGFDPDLPEQMEGQRWRRRRTAWPRNGPSPGGALFGTTAYGGGARAGTVYSVTPPAGSGGQWTGTTLYAFTGGSPTSATVAGLTIAGNGVLYGATTGGGTGACPGGCGTVFSLTPPASTGGTWTESVLYMFAGGSDGA